MDAIINYLNFCDTATNETRCTITKYEDIFNNVIKKIPIDHELILSKNDGSLYNLLAMCYRNNRRHDLMEKYYSAAIKMKNVAAMCNFAIYYEEKKNYSEMKKYYKMAIKEGSTVAMRNYARHNLNLKDSAKNKLKAQKYYLMAIEKGSGMVMAEFARAHDPANYSRNKICDDSKIALKYYHMAIDKGNKTAIGDVAWHYYVKKKYELALKYYLMAPAGTQKRSSSVIIELLVKENKYDDIEKHVDNEFEMRIGRYHEKEEPEKSLKKNNSELHIIVNYVKCKREICDIYDLTIFFKNIFPKLDFALKRKYYYKLEFIINHYLNIVTLI